jgi:hypothetical protein
VICCLLKNKNNPLFIQVFCYIWSSKTLVCSQTGGVI